MTFELIAGPHDGSLFEAVSDITDRHLYDPKAKMGVLSNFETFARARVHHYLRSGESNKLYYVGISSG